MAGDCGFVLITDNQFTPESFDFVGLRSRVTSGYGDPGFVAAANCH
jgi:hypothetical protein